MPMSDSQSVVLIVSAMVTGVAINVFILQRVKTRHRGLWRDMGSPGLREWFSSRFQSRNAGLLLWRRALLKTGDSLLTIFVAAYRLLAWGIYSAFAFGVIRWLWEWV